MGIWMEVGWLETERLCGGKIRELTEFSIILYLDTFRLDNKHRPAVERALEGAEGGWDTLRIHRGYWRGIPKKCV